MVGAGVTTVVVVLDVGATVEEVVHSFHAEAVVLMTATGVVIFDVGATEELVH